MNKKIIAPIVIIAIIASFAFWRYQTASRDVVVDENLENNELEEMINKKTE